ncbi:MAG: thioredoxin domain-containing protein [Smithellaceae bacterium]
MSTNETCASVDNLQDLKQALKENDKLIAMVYVSWCPFCRKAVPVFEKQAPAKQRNLLLVADDEERVADLYGIDIFPSLLHFEKGQVTKRLDGKPGIGLNDKQITDFIQSCSLA